VTAANPAVPGREVTRDRRIPVPGTYNLRDTGGYPATSGTTRWGRLLRSDALHAVDEDGRAQLRELGLGLVIDLRSAEEQNHAPNALDGVGHTEVRVPITSGSTASLLEFDLARIYAEFLEEHGPSLTHAVRMVATAGATPTLVHCAAGKDRTGLVIALALSAVGVAREDVIADYEVSEKHLGGAWRDALAARLARGGTDCPPEVLTSMVASPADLLRHTLEVMDAEHDGPVGYLRSHGMSEADLEALRRALVEPF
jgi:protein-tyrosine phosphatase